jgi:exopolysaccharide biosynthesis predicted pyruvyltransferase EpsI
MVPDPSRKSHQHPALHLITGLQSVLAEQTSAYEVAPHAYALLDFPNHSNVGDSAIWLGELALLTTVLGSAPAFVCDRNNFDANGLRKALPTGPIFLHGGGNFGDIWPKHQRFRESVIKLFPDRRIIQLPQTIHFTNPALIDRTARIIKRHANFVLFVRDKRSYDKARSAFECPVHLSPDMAFCLGTIPRTLPTTRNLLLLLRTDKESTRKEAPLPCNLPKGASIIDWLEEDSNLFSKMRLRTALLSPLSLGFNAFSKSRRRELLFRNLAHDRVSRGIKLLTSADYVITDRLHCHILCTLLGIPHIVLDNSYGKVSAFVETWTADCSLVSVAPSLDMAIDLWSQAV